MSRFRRLLIPQPASRRSRAILVVAAAALVAGASYAAGALVGGGGELHADDGLVPPVQASADIEVIADLFAEGGHVYALLWRGDDELWYVESGGAGELTLVQYAVDKSAARRWPVPLATPQTPHTYLVEDKAGLLWIAANYTLAAFDPASERFVFAEALPLDNAEAESAGLDESSPLPGTWVNGLMVDEAGGVVMTRNHVLATYSVATGGVAVREPLESAPSGLRRIGGRPVAFARQGGEAALLTAGAPVLPLLAADTGDCGVRADERLGELNVVAGGRGFAIPGLRFHPGDVVAADRAWFAVGLVEDGAVLRISCDTMTAERFAVGSSLELPDGGGGETAGPVAMLHSPASIAISPSGRLAFGTTVNTVALIR